MKFLFVVLLVMVVEGAHEGEPCTKEGVAGVCTNIRECPAAQEDVTNRKAPQICDFGGVEPIVCCVPSASTSEEPAVSRTKRASQSSTTETMYDDYDILDNRYGGGGSGEKCQPVSATYNTSQPTGQKAWDKCIEYQEKLIYPCVKTTSLLIGGGYNRISQCDHDADELIIGGEAAKSNEFPHMALLGYTDESSKLHWLCGGSLISENFVLTAAHCTSTTERWPLSHVLLATLRRSSMSEKNRYRVKNIIQHPQYASPSKYHDIALLELDRPVPLDRYTVPACVHTGRPVDDSRVSATGWGLTKNKGDSSDILQKVILTKFDELECAIKFTPGDRHMINGFDVRSQVCFGERTKSKDTCQGDSGGPVQIKNKEIYCMYTVVGVTSFGDECGYIGEPAVYTRVAAYLDWIERILWP